MSSKYFQILYKILPRGLYESQWYLVNRQGNWNLQDINDKSLSILKGLHTSSTIYENRNQTKLQSVYSNLRK